MPPEGGQPGDGGGTCGELPQCPELYIRVHSPQLCVWHGAEQGEVHAGTYTKFQFTLSITSHWGKIQMLYLKVCFVRSNKYDTQKLPPWKKG